MNKVSILAGGLLATLLVGAAYAQDPQAAPVQTQPTANAKAKPGKGQRNLAKMLQRQDANSDGKLAREEWKGKAEGFDRLDKDQDGFITRAELGEMGKQAGAKLRKMDANNDGQVAREEWKGKARGFDKLDANGDGILTNEELRQRRHGKRAVPPTTNTTPKPGM